MGGKGFKICKFRTMVDRAEEIGSSVTVCDDKRITSLGKILRRMKLDELPQLVNVLKGEMSLVGPRPDVPEIVERYTPDMRRILSVRPGLTSVATLHLRDEEYLLAQVADPDVFYEDVLVPFKVNLAMEHVERNSLAFDLKILCQTIWMMILGKWLPIIDEHPAVLELKEQIRYGSNKR
jgi:lipopolysaccharide/colanic/teichoic acid biosynthesis glycosyltransferase